MVGGLAKDPGGMVCSRSSKETVKGGRGGRQQTDLWARPTSSVRFGDSKFPAEL